MATVFEVTECFGTYIWIFFSEIVFIMQVADRPGDISILTHIFVSDNRTVVLSQGATCSWNSQDSQSYLGINTPTYKIIPSQLKPFILFCFWCLLFFLFVFDTHWLYIYLLHSNVNCCTHFCELVPILYFNFKCCILSCNLRQTYWSHLAWDGWGFWIGNPTTS